MKYHKFYWLTFVLFILYSCNGHYSTRRIADGYVEAEFDKDSIVNGPAKYYNRDHRLLNISNFKNGIKDGISKSFHSNGRIYDSVSYKGGLANGMHYVYDSSGVLGYVDYYLYGHQFGPEIFYKKGTVTQYYFSSFEKFELYSSVYDEFGRLTTSKGRLINATLYETLVGGEQAKGIFCYLIYPPDLNIKYQLILRDTILKNETLLRSFGNDMFVDTVVATPQAHHLYSIKAIQKNSSNLAQKVLYEDLIYQ